MPLIKLNRINKGGEILLNSDCISLVEIESGSTTVHISGGGALYSVEETPEAIAGAIEQLESDRIKNGILASGLGVQPLVEPHPPALPSTKP